MDDAIQSIHASSTVDWATRTACTESMSMMLELDSVIDSEKKISLRVRHHPAVNSTSGTDGRRPNADELCVPSSKPPFQTARPRISAIFTHYGTL